jgi:hypothetical protein
MSDELVTKQARSHMSSVRKAREALRARAEEILESYLTLAAQAAAEKDFETAADILWKLIDHNEDEDGERIISASSSKPPTNTSSAPTGPAIQIGIALGGLGTQVRELPKAEVIDVSPINANNKPSAK